MTAAAGKRGLSSGRLPTRRAAQLAQLQEISNKLVRKLELVVAGEQPVANLGRVESQLLLAVLRDWAPKS